MRATRRVQVVDNRPLALRIGQRIKTVRLSRGMTQAEVAGDRYTAAYISALETGAAKPSMAALRFLSERLGTPVAQFVDADERRLRRVDADLKLAAGDWDASLTLYRQLTNEATDVRSRAEALRGQAEALMRLDRASEAVAPAAESVEGFRSLNADADAVAASYWLAYAHARSENYSEARQLLEHDLAEVRAGLNVMPDFEFRLLTALGNVAALEGRHEVALSYLNEAHGMSGDLDLRRRASFLAGLSLSYRQVGDLEASLVAGSQGLALFQASDSFLEISSLANNLALTYLAVGNAERAEEFARQALARAEEFGDEQLVAHITETRSRICLAAGRTDEALEFANKAIDIAQRSGTAIPMASALAMRGRIAASRRDFERARDDLSAAASAFRLHGQVSNLRDVLGELADVLFELGDTEGGKQAYKDALGRQ